MDIDKYIQNLHDFSFSNNLTRQYADLCHVGYYVPFAFMIKKLYGVFTPLPHFYYSITYTSIERNPSILRPLFRFLKNIDKEVFCILLHLKGHSNLLIYRKSNNSLTFFDPNGITFDKFFLQYHIIIQQAKNIIPDIEIISSAKLHDNMSGLQMLSKDGNYGGLCASWCFLIFNITMKFPNIDIKDIIFTHFRLNSDMNRKKLSIFLKNVVVGFIHKFMNYIKRNLDENIELIKDDLEYRRIIYTRVNSELDEESGNDSSNLKRYMNIDPSKFDGDYSDIF